MPERLNPDDSCVVVSGGVIATVWRCVVVTIGEVVGASVAPETAAVPQTAQLSPVLVRGAGCSSSPVPAGAGMRKRPLAVQISRKPMGVPSAPPLAAATAMAEACSMANSN